MKLKNSIREANMFYFTVLPLFYCALPSVNMSRGEKTANIIIYLIKCYLGSRASLVSLTAL